MTLQALSNLGVCGRNRLTKVLALEALYQGQRSPLLSGWKVHKLCVNSEIETGISAIVYCLYACLYEAVCWCVHALLKFPQCVTQK